MALAGARIAYFPHFFPLRDLHSPFPNALLKRKLARYFQIRFLLGMLQVVEMDGGMTSKSQKPQNDKRYGDNLLFPRLVFIGCCESMNE